MAKVVEALVEIPLGSKNKYEVDEKTGRIRLDRVLYSAMTYPTEYGYVCDTLALDGDPLDILVIASNPTFPGCIVPARVLGYLEMWDGGVEDFKLISVVDCDPRYAEVQDLSDLPAFELQEISNFFRHYKSLQGVRVTTGEYRGQIEAYELISACEKRFRERAE